MDVVPLVNISQTSVGNLDSPSRKPESSQSARTPTSTSTRGLISDGKRLSSSRSSVRGDHESHSTTPIPSVSRGPTPSMVAEPRTPKALVRKWISLGSEEEIKPVGPTRDLIKLSISRKRREFGAPNKFSDRDAHDGLVECRPFKNPNYELVMREADVGTQGVPQVASAHTQTTWYRKVNATTQYESMELDAAHRAIAQRAPEFVPFLVNAMSECVSLALQQNEAIDLFRPDFPDQADEEAALFGGKADNVLREIQSFTDLRHSKDKVIACIDWMPNAKGVVAVACLENPSFEERVAQSGKVRSSLILIWNFVDPIHPQALLEAPNDVTALRFHPTIPTTLVAGCANGQILFYDLSSLKGPTTTQPLKDGDPNAAQRPNLPLLSYTVSSSIEASHRTPVLDIVWLTSTQEVNKGAKSANAPLLDPTPPKTTLIRSVSTKTGMATVPSLLMSTSSQFITAGPDGQLLLWDIRFKKDVKEMDLFWMPAYRMSLTRSDMREELTLANIVLASTGTKMVAATEDGELVLGDWGSMTEGTKVQAWVNPWHQGPMKSLSRSPFFEDVLLTVGDWTVAIWKERAGNKPLLGSPYSAAAVTVGRWSPTRPGVFYVGKVDGSIDVWDLMDKSHVPTLTQQVASCAITSMEFPLSDTPAASRQTTNQFVVGDEAGTLHLLEIPKNLVRQPPNERALVDTFLKREQARVESNSRRLTETKES